MCGLCGVAGSITHVEVDAFKELLYVSALRGMDSTGVSVFMRQSATDPYYSTTLKTVGTPTVLIDSKQYEKTLQYSHKRILMGHTRHATVGEIRVSNAHPFEFNRWVGAHNGTLDYSARRDLPYHNYFDTDSEALISAINDKGIEPVINEMDGAWALSLVDKQNGLLHFLRNKERDLCFCFNKRRDCVFWASEPAFLRFVLEGRKNIEIFQDKIWRFNENVLYTFQIPDWSQSIKDADRLVVKGRQHFLAVSRGGSGTRVFPEQHSDVIDGRVPERIARNVLRDAKKQSEAANILKLLTKHNIIPENDTDIHIQVSNLPDFHENFYEVIGKRKNKHFLFRGWNGQMWNDRTFIDRTSQGCAMCCMIPEWGNNLLFCRENAFLCSICMEDEGCEEGAFCGDLGVSVGSGTEEAIQSIALPSIN